MGEVVPFTPRVTERPDVLSWWHCAGDIFQNAGGRGLYFTRERAEARRDWYARQAARYQITGGAREASHCARMFMQLTRALDAQDHHNRITGRRA